MMLRILFIALLVLVRASSADAAPITFTAAGTNPGTGTSLSASAKFDFDAFSSKLVITLTNTSMADVVASSDVLTAVFFDVSGNLALTPVSAILASGSKVWFDTAPAGGEVGGEWAYARNFSGGPLGAIQGIGSAGFGIFGSPNFRGSDLDAPLAVDGINYGITSKGDNTTTGNSKVTGDEPLIQNSVIFRLGGVSAGFDPSKAIFNVSFQYGTDLSEPNTQPVPEPGAMLLLSSGLAAALARRVRRRRA